MEGRHKLVSHNTPLVHPGTKAYYQYRLLEILPGFLSWGILVACILLSFTAPLVAVYLIILYDFYWLVRVAYLSVYMIGSWRKYRQAIKIDWFEKLKSEVPNWQQYKHLIFLPMYREPYEIVEVTLEKIMNSAYDSKQMAIVLTGEGRVEDHFRPIAEKIQQKFGQAFNKLIINIHPDGIEGEMQTKGANMRHSAIAAKAYVDEQGWSYDKVIVSSFDIDTWVHPQYFADLTYTYAQQKDPTRHSYQPLTVYHNNVWKSDPITRVVAYSTTFWLLTDLARAERLFTFSSHSMSFKALVDVGFWEPDVVSDDSRIFLQCFLRYQGDYDVKPIFVPVSMSTVYMGKFWRSMRNQYIQIRRWAWGVENFAYMAWYFSRDSSKNIPLSKKTKFIFNYLEGNFSWATSALLISILGFIPFKAASLDIKQLAIVQNAPLILEWLLSVAMIGLVINAILGTWMLPDEPQKKNPLILFLMLAQYALVFVSMVLFGAFPALNSQMRHILAGRFRLGFWVTEKSKA